MHHGDSGLEFLGLVLEVISFVRYRLMPIVLCGGQTPFSCFLEVASFPQTFLILPILPLLSILSEQKSYLKSLNNIQLIFIHEQHTNKLQINAFMFVD